MATAYLPPAESCIAISEPEGKIVNRQGRQPLEPGATTPNSPEGAAPTATLASLPPRWGCARRGLPLSQGLTPLAIDWRPFGTEEDAKLETIITPTLHHSTIPSLHHSNTPPFRDRPDLWNPPLQRKPFQGAWSATSTTS